MDILVSILLFIFGAIFGSFGSVLLWRLQGNIDKNTIMGILFGQSKCTSCNHTLGIKDLFPFFSWFLNHGKCRYCGSKISILYPVIELLSGLVFVFSYYICGLYLGYYDILSYPFIVNLIFICFFNWSLILFLLSDILFFSLNVRFWLISLILIIMFQFFGVVGNFFLSFVGAISFFLVFYGIYHFAKIYVKLRFGYKGVEGFGEGDVMIAFWIGLLTPFVLSINKLIPNIYNIVVLSFMYLLLSSLLGIVFAGLSAIFYKGKQGKSIPFLPAMIFAFWLILIFGKYLISFI